MRGRRPGRDQRHCSRGRSFRSAYRSGSVRTSEILPLSPAPPEYSRTGSVRSGLQHRPGTRVLRQRDPPIADDGPIVASPTAISPMDSGEIGIGVDSLWNSGQAHEPTSRMQGKFEPPVSMAGYPPRRSGEPHGLIDDRPRILDGSPTGHDRTSDSRPVISSLYLVSRYNIIGVSTVLL